MDPFPNPFDLRGPEFLLFYFVFSLIIVLITYIIRIRMENEPFSGRLLDPYMIAFLRGGKNEMLMVATASLFDRGLLQQEGSWLKAFKEATNIPRNSVDQKILEHFAIGRSAESLLEALEFHLYSNQYEEQLRQLNFLPNDATQTRRRNLLLISAFLAIGVGLAKIMIALSRGHTNILFLVLMMIAVFMLLKKATHPRLTETGQKALKGYQQLLMPQKERLNSISPLSGSNELALLAAVYGLSAVPAVASLWPSDPRRLSSDSSSWGSTSSCSSGGSCGSSCGGGGCGGGCGGCGS